MVIYGRGKKIKAPGVVHVGGEFLGKCNAARARISGVMYGGCEWETKAIISRLRAEKPDVVHLQCINGNFVNIYRLISFLKQEMIPTVLTLHAEFMYTANCSHAYDCEKWRSGCGACPDARGQTHSWLLDRTGESWKRMAAAFEGFDKLTVVSVSPWQENRAQKATFFRSARFRTILNGVDTSVFHPLNKESDNSRHDVRQVLYVTPHFTLRPGHVKGGEFLYPLAEQLGDHAKILAVGTGDWGNAPSNVRVIGPIWDRKRLAQLYAESDVTLLTSKRETFSMVTAESLCCGTPVVGFLAGGPESIAISAFSRFCTPGNVEELVEAVMSIPLTDARIVAEEAFRRYGKDNTIHNYLDEYQKVGMQS